MGLGGSKHPLHEACSNGNLTKVVELLADGEDCNQKDEDGWTPLHFAAWGGHDAVIEALYGAGADVNACDKKRRTPLHLATLTGHPGATAFLLRHGADAGAQDDHGMTALHKAVTQGFENVVHELLNLGADSNRPLPDGTTPLHLAAWKGYVGIVKELLAMGARADRANVTGQSALHEAASQGHTDVVRVLLEAGAMPNRQDSEGLTPAALALRAGFRDLASELAQRIREAKTEGWWTTFAAQHGVQSSAAVAQPAPLPVASVPPPARAPQGMYPAVELPAPTSGPHAAAARRYGLTEAEGEYGDWAPRAEVEGEEGGWDAVDEAPQQSLMARVHGMLSQLAAMLPIGAVAPAEAAAAPATAPQAPSQRGSAQEQLKKQERDLQTKLASQMAEAAGPSRDQAAAGPSGPRLERAEHSRVEAQEVEIAALKQQLEALRVASRVADTAERPVVAPTPQCQSYSFDELFRATNGFSDDARLGYGRHSVVYRGTLNGTPVAIKWLDPEAVQLGPSFQERASELASLRHPNLLPLLGACPENGCLVYEYSENGSLEDSLRAKRPPGRAGPIRLTWPARTRLAAELANALHYLHTQRPEAVLHGGVRPSNVLLADDTAARLGDVGLPSLLHEAAPTRGRWRATGRPRGALAHTDPAVLQGQPYGPQSEVYSLGVTLLQLLTGMEASGLVEHVEAAAASGRLADVVDPCAGDWDLENASSLAHLALRCVAWRQEERPDLARDILPELSRLAGAAEALAAQPHPASAARGKPPAMLLCPISQDVFEDPVIAADGHTYERKAIQQWLDLGHRTSPMTNEELAHTNLTANWALRSAAVEWREASEAPAPPTATAPAAPRENLRTDSSSTLPASSAPAASAGTAARPNAAPPASCASASASETPAAVPGNGAGPLPLPDWASPGYRAPPVEQRAAVGARAEVDAIGVGGLGVGEAEHGSDLGDEGVEQMDEDAEVSGRGDGEEAGPGVREGGGDGAAEEGPVVIEVEGEGAGEDVEMTDVVEVEEFDDTQLLHWPRAPSHRISSRADVERLPALA